MGLFTSFTLVSVPRIDCRTVYFTHGLTFATSRCDDYVLLD